MWPRRTNGLLLAVTRRFSLQALYPMVGLCQNVANVGLVAVPWLGGHIVVLSHLRFAAGVCVLAAGLLMGSAGSRPPLPMPIPAILLRAAMAAPTLQERAVIRQAARSATLLTLSGRRFRA